jgi:hypothetical protein
MLRTYDTVAKMEIEAIVGAVASWRASPGSTPALGGPRVVSSGLGRGPTASALVPGDDNAHTPCCTATVAPPF